MAILTGQTIDPGVAFTNAVYLSGGVWYKWTSGNDVEGVYLGNNTVNTSGPSGLTDEKSLLFRNDPYKITTSVIAYSLDFVGTNTVSVTPTVDPVEVDLVDGNEEDLTAVNVNPGAESFTLYPPSGVEYSEDGGSTWLSGNPTFNLTSEGDTKALKFRHDPSTGTLTVPSNIRFDGTVLANAFADVEADVDCGSVQIGSSGIGYLTLDNPSASSTTISIMTAPTNFRLRKQGDTTWLSVLPSFTINSLGSQVIEYQYSPLAQGLVTSDATLTYNPTLTIPLSGTGTGFIVPETPYRTFEVVFEPVAEGTYSSTIEIVSDSITSPDQITVTGLGVGEYVPTDVTVTYGPFKYAANNIYRAGAVTLGSSITNNISESLIKIKNVEAFEGLTFDITKKIPAPPETINFIIAEVDSLGQEGSSFEIQLPDAEPLNIKGSSTNLYYTDTSNNDTLWFYPNSKDVLSLVANDGSLVSKLTTLVHSELVYANTGTLWKYGYITLLNYILNNVEKFSKICILNNVAYDDLNYYEVNTPGQCWREKNLKELRALMTDATIHDLVTRYDINYDYTDIEIVLYYFMDIYNRIFNG